MTDNTLIGYYSNDNNIDLSGILNNLKSDYLKTITFLANMHKMIISGQNINIKLITKSDASNNTLVYLGINSVNQYESLYNNIDTGKTCERIYKFLKTNNSKLNLTIPIINSSENSIYLNSLVSFNYDETNTFLKSAVDFVIIILTSIIETSNQNQIYNITLEMHNFGDSDIYGDADPRPDIRKIRLNSINDSSKYLNDVLYSIYNIVLLHEVFHILGLVGVGSPGETFINKQLNIYTGENGNKQYKNLLQENMIDGKIIFNTDILNESDISNIVGIPIENNFGEGTAHGHFEEGYNETNHEVRYINEIFHPTLMNEIMSGFLDDHNYLTPLTLGVLEDLGFSVNYNSEYVVRTGTNMVFK